MASSRVSPSMRTLRTMYSLVIRFRGSMRHHVGSREVHLFAIRDPIREAGEGSARRSSLPDRAADLQFVLVIALGLEAVETLTDRAEVVEVRRRGVVAHGEDDEGGRERRARESGRREPDRRRGCGRRRSAPAP